MREIVENVQIKNVGLVCAMLNLFDSILKETKTFTSRPHPRYILLSEDFVDRLAKEIVQAYGFSFYLVEEDVESVKRNIYTGKSMLFGLCILVVKSEHFGFSVV